VSEGLKRKAPPTTEGNGARAFGAPSAGLSLVRLRPRRAGLRFTQRVDCTDQRTDIARKVRAIKHRPKFR